MAEKKQKLARGMGSVYRRPRSSSWWISYYVNGKLFRESAETKSYNEAVDRLKERNGQVSKGTFDGLKMKRTTVQQLADDLIRNYTNNELASLPDLKARWELHLNGFFGHLKAVQVTTETIERYKEERKKEGARNGTINRELAALKRMFNLAQEANKDFNVPVIRTLPENNVRKGFVEPEQYSRLADQFGKVGLWARSLFECGYVFGWRVSELLNLQVRQVNFLNRTITLDPGTTKNDEGRTVVMTETVYQLLRQCCEGKTAEQHVFTRFLAGRHKPIVDFRETWWSCCADAGCPDLLFHDLRRTAVRNMVRAGVPETVAMKISGHKTRSVFDRYNITSERDLAEASRKLEQHQSQYSHFEHTGTQNEEAQPATGRAN